MPEYYDEFPRKRPRRRSRSSSPPTEFGRHPFSLRRSQGEDVIRHDRRGARESSGSPPARRHRSKSREEDHERNTKRGSFAGTTSRPPRRHGDFRGGEFQEGPKHSSIDHTDSRSPPPKHRRQDLSSPPSKYRRRNSYSPRPDDHRGNSRKKDRYQDRKGSPRPKDDHPSTTPAPSKRSNAPLPSQQAAFTKTSDSPSDGLAEPDGKAEKLKPNYAPSGLLAAETNTVANTNIVLKYNEPPESRLPPSSQPWRLYVFKNKDLLNTIPLHTRPCWLFGRETAVCDIPVEHPSASKQHAVLQFRYLEKIVGEYGEKKGKVGLYILDLDSANGTKLNGEVLPGRRFIECKTGDMVQFGESTREYVVLLPPKD